MEYFDLFHPDNATSMKTLKGADWELLYKIAHKTTYILQCIISLKIDNQKSFHEMIKYNGLDADGRGVVGYLTASSIQGRWLHYKETKEEREQELIKLMANKWEDIVDYLFDLQYKIQRGEFSNDNKNQPDLFGEL
jgi:hypothetical protein